MNLSFQKLIIKFDVKIPSRILKLFSSKKISIKKMVEPPKLIENKNSNVIKIGTSERVKNVETQKVSNFQRIKIYFINLVEAISNVFKYYLLLYEIRNRKTLKAGKFYENF